MVSRFGSGIAKLNALRDRVSGALDVHRRRLEQHEERQRSRRMSDAQTRHADALYEALETEHLGRDHERLQLPREHALSWVHTLVNWEDVFAEGSRLYGIVRARHKLREAGTPHAEIVKQQPTGYHYLDDAHHSSPSILGDAVRRLLYRKETGADPPWHHTSVTHRARAGWRTATRRAWRTTPRRRRRASAACAGWASPSWSRRSPRPLPFTTRCCPRAPRWRAARSRFGRPRSGTWWPPPSAATLWRRPTTSRRRRAPTAPRTATRSASCAPARRSCASPR